MCSMPQSPTETIPNESQSSGFDRAPTFRAYEQQLPSLSDAMVDLYGASTPVPRVVTDPDQLLVLSHDEIQRIWGLFPEAARSRALPTRLQGDGPQWFSNVSGTTPELTREPSEAISPTSFALGVSQYLW